MQKFMMSASLAPAVLIALFFVLRGGSFERPSPPLQPVLAPGDVTTGGVSTYPWTAIRVPAARH